MRTFIYGAGVVGVSLYEFLRDSGIDSDFGDDNLDARFVNASNYISFDALKIDNYDIYFVCAMQDSAVVSMQTKLLKIGAQKEKIKILRKVIYKHSMQYLLKSFFTKNRIAELMGDANLVNFLSQIQKMQDKYFLDKKEDLFITKEYRVEIDKAADSHIFNKINLTARWPKVLKRVLFPGFILPYSSVGEDKEFYFIEYIDWDFIINNREHIKLVACFGDSCMRGEYLNQSERVTTYLREIIGQVCGGGVDYLIINFGVSGYSLYEQMLLYNALVFPLKPEIVISLFGVIDINNRMGCERMLDWYKMHYNPYFSEVLHSDIVNSNMPLYYQLRHLDKERNINVKYEHIDDAVAIRLEQFCKIVECNEGRFFGFLMPFKWIKEEWSNQEKIWFDENFKGLNAEEYLAHIKLRYNCFKNRLKNFSFFYDLNSYTKGVRETLYVDGGHLNGIGNEIVADRIVEILRQEGLIS